VEIGIALPQYRIDVEKGGVWDAMRAIARRADDVGLDAVWLSDHPFAVGPDGVASGALEPLAAAAALIRGLPRIAVGTLVLAPTMRAPGLAAHTARAIAGVATDRFVVGLGAGWYEPEHRAFGVSLPSYAGRVALLSEHLAALHALGGDRPRILCGGTGDAVLDLAARHADVWNMAWDVSPEAFATSSARLDAACARAGRDPATVRRTVGLTVSVAEHDDGLARAVDRLRERAVFLRDVSPETLTGRIVAGTPERCAETIAAYGADGVVAALLLRDDTETVELFGERVAPLLRRSAGRAGGI
jgi:alkanesulfonate monooxygenase SsuD/methylene tetrahydromethanopterin reductase-like flavin-dependent oxidoreductase (luciferase family)